VNTTLYPTAAQLSAAALWGLVLLMSFAGWGSLVAQLAYPRRRPDLGLRIAWGMAAVIAVGGVACLVGLATRAGLLVLVVTGLAYEFRAMRDRRRREDAAPGAAGRPSWAVFAVLAGCALLAGLQYCGAASGGNLMTDDYTAYLIFPQKILVEGTLIEPFSLRRLAAYGAQSLLHALTLIGASSPEQISLLDMGICLLAVLALVIGRLPRTVGLWVLPVLFVLTLPDVRANSTSFTSGVVFFVALFRTASAAELAASPYRGIVLGLLAAAAAALRQPYIVPAVAFLGLLAVPDLIGALRAPRAQRFRQLVGCAAAPAAMCVFLLPWALLSYRSSGTLLYPLFSGYYHDEYGALTAATSLAERWDFLWLNIRHHHPVRALPLFLLAAVLLPWRRTSGALPALAVAAVLGFVAIVWSFPLSDSISMSRYYSGFTVAATLAVTMQAGALRWGEWRRSLLQSAAPAVLVMAALVLQVPAVLETSYWQHVALVQRLRTAFTAPRPLDAERHYRNLQARVPEGAPLLVMLDRPYWLDFARNPIDVIDLPGQVSPPPGMAFDDDEALVDYLAAQGYRYVAFVRSTASESQYGREGWLRMLGPPPSALWGKAAPFVLTLFDRLESLTASRILLYDDNDVVVLDLATRAP